VQPAIPSRIIDAKPCSFLLLVEESVILNSVRCMLGLLLALGSAPAEKPPAHLTVVLITERPYSGIAIRAMGREAAGILKPSGISLDWRLGTPVQAFEGLLVVVTLRGQCSMAETAPEAKIDGPLGWTHTVNGAVLPFAELACDTIRGAVKSGMRAEHRSVGDFLLGRAMGRVLAHELYHITGDTARHATAGVAQPAFSAREMVSQPMALEPRDAEIMGSRLQTGR
jgi:hypothetical protein